jgi:L-cysteine/cystine lyase
MEPDAKVKFARALIPVSAHSAYLNTASLGPVSTIYAQTLAACTSSDLTNGRAVAPRYERMRAATECIREEIAALVGAESRQIVLTQSTSDGLAAAIAHIAWQAGDEVVTTDAEHEACAEPIARLQQRHGVITRVAAVPAEPAENLDWLLTQMSPRTRLVAFSAVTFKNGYRMPVERIVESARTRGVQTLLDAAQCVGAAPLALADWGVDYCAMPLQKWLCGPDGLGALYVRDGTTAAISRDRVVRDWGTLEATAEHLATLSRALGWNWILARTAALARHARQCARTVPGWTLETPAEHAGLVTIRSSHSDIGHVVDHLQRSNFVFRYRPETQSLRIATAFFNTESEIDSFFAAIRAFD